MWTRVLGFSFKFFLNLGRMLEFGGNFIGLVFVVRVNFIWVCVFIGYGIREVGEGFDLRVFFCLNFKVEDIVIWEVCF